MKAALAPPETSNLPKAGGNGGRGGPLAGGIGVPARGEALVGVSWPRRVASRLPTKVLGLAHGIGVFFPSGPGRRLFLPEFN